MGYDYVKTVDGKDAWASVAYLGCNHPLEITLGETKTTLSDFLLRVQAYLESTDGERDTRETFKSALAQACLEPRERSGSYFFKVPSKLEGSDPMNTQPFEFHGLRLPVNELYVFVWYVLQKVPIDSFPNDTRYQFLKRFAPNLVNPGEFHTASGGEKSAGIVFAAFIGGAVVGGIVVSLLMSKI